MNRQDHIEWAKARALAELNTDPCGDGPLNALASINSDLRKHPETENHTGIDLGIMMAMSGLLNTESQVRDHINGFR